MAADEYVRLAPPLGVVQLVVGKNVRQERIVHLHVQPGIDDRLVFGAHGVAEGKEKRLVVLVEFVEADAARCGRRQEPLVDAGRSHGRLQVGDVAVERVLADIFDFLNGENLDDRRDHAAQHPLGKIIGIIFGKRRLFGGVQFVLVFGPRHETAQAFLRVDKETGL